MLVRPSVIVAEATKLGRFHRAKQPKLGQWEGLIVASAIPSHHRVTTEGNSRLDHSNGSWEAFSPMDVGEYPVA